MCFTPEDESAIRSMTDIVNSIKSTPFASSRNIREKSEGSLKRDIQPTVLLVDINTSSGHLNLNKNFLNIVENYEPVKSRSEEEQKGSRSNHTIEVKSTRKSSSDKPVKISTEIYKDYQRVRASQSSREQMSSPKALHAADIDNGEYYYNPTTLTNRFKSPQSIKQSITQRKSFVRERQENEDPLIHELDRITSPQINQYTMYYIER